MQAKTFESIQEAAAVNYNFFRARSILDWIQTHPSPPPFNVLEFVVGIPLQLLVARALPHDHPAAAGGDAPGAQGDAESHI